jgi:hypothetical protein
MTNSRGVAGVKTARVVKKNKKIQPQELEKGCKVTVKTPYSHPATTPSPPIRYRPGRILEIASDDGRSGYVVEMTDTEGGVLRGVPLSALEPLPEFNFDQSQPQR